MTSAPDFLNNASSLLEERGKTYDQEGGERSMARIVAAFNALTGENLCEAKGWLFMVCMKHVRQFSKQEWHADSSIDAIAYEALLAECCASGGKKAVNT